MKKGEFNFPGIYTITCTASGKIYVGQTINVRRRWHNHKWHLRKGDHRNSHLQRSWNKNGESAFVFAVVEDLRATPGAELKAALDAAEVRILSAVPDAFNLMEAAKSGTIPSDETRAKLSAIRKAMWQDPEFKARRQAGHMAAIATPEWKARHAEIARERSLDKDFKAKMRAVNKANWTPGRAKKRGKLEKANWDDPAYREKQAKSRSLAWQDPEVRDKRIAGMKAAHARRKSTKAITD